MDAGNSQLPRLAARAPPSWRPRAWSLLDMGVSGGIWGLQVGFCAMLGGKREVFDRFEPAVRDAGAGGRLPVLRSGRGRALRQDGPQRDRVRAHAGLRRGLRHPARLATSSWTSPPSPACGSNGSVIRSWLLELAGDAFTRRATTWPRSRAGSPIRARAAGRWPRRSSTTCRRPIITLSLLAALPQPARAGQLHRSGAGRAAQRVRRPRGEAVGRPGLPWSR